MAMGMYAGRCARRSRLGEGAEKAVCTDGACDRGEADDVDDFYGNVSTGWTKGSGGEVWSLGAENPTKVPV